MLLVIAGMFVLAGCERSTTETTGSYYLPKGLEDCRLYTLESGFGNRLKVMRCPNSDTALSYKSGKTTKYSATTED